jgi:hypothetical protein
MKFYVVMAVRTPGKVDVFHHELFHGKMERSDFKVADKPAHDIGDDLSAHVWLTRSGAYIPPLFQPGIPILVTNNIFIEINKKLKVLGVIAKPKKLINFWLPAGDESYLWSKEFSFLKNRPDKILEKAPNDPRLFDDFPLCYELVAFNASRDPSLVKTHELSIKLKRDDLVNVKRNVSKENMEKYPICWCGMPILRFDLFEILEKYIDLNYFEIMEISI